MWLFPISVIAIPTLLAFPLSRYLAWIMDGQYRPPKLLKWFEGRLGRRGLLCFIGGVCVDREEAGYEGDRKDNCGGPVGLHGQVDYHLRWRTR